jgi:hypothetical protein
MYIKNKYYKLKREEHGEISGVLVPMKKRREKGEYKEKTNQSYIVNSGMLRDIETNAKF